MVPRRPVCDMSQVDQGTLDTQRNGHHNNVSLILVYTKDFCLKKLHQKRNRQSRVATTAVIKSLAVLATSLLR